MCPRKRYYQLVPFSVVFIHTKTGDKHSHNIFKIIITMIINNKYQNKRFISIYALSTLRINIPFLPHREFFNREPFSVLKRIKSYSK